QGLAVIGDEGESAADSSAGDSAAQEASSDEEPAASQDSDEAPAESAESPAPAAQEQAPASESADAQEVTLPELSESVTEGTVTRCLKGLGDTIEVDQPIVEISTDKVDTEIPSPVAGTVLEIKVQEDEDIEVGQ